MSPLLLLSWITICTTVRKVLDILLVVESLIHSKKYVIKQNKNYSSIYKSIIITSLIGFNIDLWQYSFNLYQRFAMFFRRCFNVGHWCFIFNVGSKLFQRWSTTLKQPWSNIEMLTGYFVYTKQTSRKKTVLKRLKI